MILMEKLISILVRDKEVLEKECQEMDICYDKLNKVLNGIKIGRIEIDDLDSSEVIKVLMRVYLSIKAEKEYNNELFNETKFLDYIIDKMNKYDAIDVITCLDKVLEEVSVDSLIDLFKNNKINLDFSKNSKKVKNLITLSARIIELKALVGASKFPILEMFQYMKDNKDDDLICKSACYGCCMAMQNDQSYTEVKEVVLGNVFLSICTTVVDDSSSEFLHKTKSTLTNLRKKVNAYDEIIKYLNESKNKKEIIGLPVSYKKLDDSAQLQLVKTIYNHNMIYNKELEKQYLKSSQDQVKLRKQLLKKYNINTNDLFYEFEYEELDSILKSLSEMNIIDENTADILKEIDVNKLETVLMQYKLGFINSEFISEHKDIIANKDSDNYKNLVFNIRKFKEAKIPRNVINRHNDILLTDSKIISNNFATIDVYSYQDTLRKTENISFISNDDLSKKIDILLELGYETNLDEDLSLLGYDISRYKRLEICRKLNIVTDTTEEIKSILDKDKFIIKDEHLDDYILDISEYNNNSSISKDELKEKLSQCQVSNRVYDINGVKVSKIKADKELDKKESFTQTDIFSILAKNKKLNREDYDSIVNFISNKKVLHEKIKLMGKIVK